MQEETKMMALRKWILHNEKDWFTICGLGKTRITVHEYKRLHRLLVENGFEEMTLVLLTCHIDVVQEKIFGKAES